jgi:hypothetical protein
MFGRELLVKLHIFFWNEIDPCNKVHREKVDNDWSPNIYLGF